MRPSNFRLAQKNFLRGFNEISQVPWSKSFNHLQDLPPRMKKMLAKYPHKKSAEEERLSVLRQIVPVKDRIKLWNIVPGDMIRVCGEEDNIRQVFGVNKFKNLVYLRNTKNNDDENEEVPSNPPSVHYSKCELFLGEREFPPAPGETEGFAVPVFATKITCTTPRYDPFMRRYDWTRRALETDPPLLGMEKEGMVIPWPTYTKPTLPPLNPDMDTPATAAKEVTWNPTTLFYPPSSPKKVKALEDAYLRHINPSATGIPTMEYEPTRLPPMEYMIATELSNPHGGTRRKLRAEARLEERKKARSEFFKAELANLDGRTRKEAGIEAEFKWKERLRHEKKVATRLAWIKRGARAKVLWKRERKAKKENRQLEQLKSLELLPADNQSLPPTVTV
ncbi:hypothetical protein M422DRAFT_184625 [Sphaerobolus stellatus SS14]|uniref:Uncharacterized protein n=1 Tax=Sphaerobolus stellatus (strain SS14) TaxID=990650 RepID=A0A0C9V4E5_SPHS4|nr:hypothetical protein M422DRAFT_184625 [Sphaerobolus stellatus SS14]